MRALSIRQPYVELILRGLKTIEYRSRPTRIVGERFYLYAAKKPASLPSASLPSARVPAMSGSGIAASGKPWSLDLAMPSGTMAPPRWMLELAEQVRMVAPGTLLPTGVIVGTAIISNVSRGDGVYEWHLSEVERIHSHRKPTGHPQPAWFKPFD